MLSSRSAIMRALLILLVTFACYGQSLDNFWIKDDLAVGNFFDGESMTFDAWLRELWPAGMKDDLYWRPIPLLPGYLEHAIWGLDVRGYHLTNTLLQALCGIAAMLLCDRLLGKGLPRAGLLAGLFVVVAPTGAEATIWVMQRMVLMTTLFSLAALCLWTSAVDTGRRPGRIAALFLFVLALLSKETALTLPGLFFALDLACDPAAMPMSARFRRALRWAIPSAILIGLYFAARWLLWGRLTNTYAEQEVFEYARQNRVFERLPESLRNGLLPLNGDMLGASFMGILRPTLIACWGFVVVRGIIVAAGSRRSALAILFGLLFALLTLLPILPIFWIDARLFNARFFHGVTAGLSIVVATALLVPARGFGRGLVDLLGKTAAIVFVAALTVSLAAQIVAFERGSDQILGIRAQLIEAQKTALTAGFGKPVFVCLDVPAQYRGVPTLEYSLVQAMQPPLTTPGVSCIPLLARDRETRGRWLADLRQGMAELDARNEALHFVRCTSAPFGISPVFAAREGAAGDHPPVPVEPADLAYLENGGPEPSFVFHCADERVRSFRLCFRTPAIDFAFGPVLVPGENLEVTSAGRFVFRSSMRDPSQPELPDLWEKVVRGTLPDPLPLSWQIEARDENDAVIGVSNEQRMLVFDAGQN